MTYKDVVNRIQEVVNQHLMLSDFGYGDLSDLKTRFENTSGDEAVQADYPYAFLNPGQHQRSQSAVTYNFNLIVMDMARGEVSDDPYNNMLTIQSQCQQYIDDIIARLYYHYTDKPQVLWNSLTYTPFNERFQDDVAGMTVNLQILVPNPINECIAPFEDETPPSEGTDLDVRVTLPQTVNGGSNYNIPFDTVVDDVYLGWNTENSAYYTEPTTLQITTEINFTIDFGSLQPTDKLQIEGPTSAPHENAWVGATTDATQTITDNGNGTYTLTSYDVRESTVLAATEFWPELTERKWNLQLQVSPSETWTITSARMIINKVS